MAWITVTESDLRGSLSGAEMAGYRAAVLATFTLAGNLVASSAVITSISSTARLAAGMTATGTGIPAGRTILTVDSATQVTLDSGTGVSAGTAVSIAFAQPDPVPGMISRVVDLVRGYVAANPANRLGAGETIPEKLLDPALAITRYRMLSRLPIPIDESRIDEKDDALELLKQVAAGKFAIEEPLTADTEAIAGPGTTLIQHSSDVTDYNKISET